MVRAVMRRTLVRHAAWVVVVSVLCATFLAVSTVVSAAVQPASAALADDPGLRLVKVTSGHGASANVDAEAVTEFAALPGVDEVVPVLQVPATLEGDSTPRWITPLVPALAPTLITGRLPEAGSEVLVSVGPHEHPPTLGPATLRLAAHTGAVLLTVDVVGVSADDPASYSGPSVVLATPGLANEALGAMMGQSPDEASSSVVYDVAYLSVRSIPDVPAVQAALRDQVFDASSVAGAEPAVPQGLALLTGSRGWLAGLVVACVIVAGAVVGTGLKAERSREVGVLRAVGWTSARVLGLHVIEVGALGLLTACAGLALGQALCFVAAGLGGNVLPDVELPALLLADPTTAALIVVALPVGCILGALPAVRSLAALSPDDALRSLT